jgi:hypothetical protein
MIDLDKIDEPTLMARGIYSTVRAAHEDQKKSLQMLCGQLAATSSQVLRRMQPDSDDVPESVDDLLAAGRATLDSIEACVREIESLARQRGEWKQSAWGKTPP